MSRWYISRLVIFSLVGLGLHEISNIIYYFDPNTANIFPEHMYISKEYKAPKISVLYFFYELAPYIDNLIKSIILYKVAAHVSDKLKQVAFWFCILYIVLIYFYLYDRNTNFWASIILYGIISVICLITIWPDKEFSKMKKI